MGAGCVCFFILGFFGCFCWVSFAFFFFFILLVVFCFRLGFSGSIAGVFVFLFLVACCGVMHRDWFGSLSVWVGLCFFFSESGVCFVFCVFVFSLSSWVVLIIQY